MYKIEKFPYQIIVMCCCYSSEKPASSQQQDNGTAEQKETNNNGTEEEVPSVVEMTLDEYKAKMYGNRAKPQYQERVVEKGLGDQWKDSVVFERSEDEYIPSQRVSVAATCQLH